MPDSPSLELSSRANPHSAVRDSPSLELGSKANLEGTVRDSLHWSLVREVSGHVFCGSCGIRNNLLLKPFAAVKRRIFGNKFSQRRCFLRFVLDA